MSRYSGDMFEVLAFVYDNYWYGDTCPALPTLQRKLNQVGFADDEIVPALVWLEELKRASQNMLTSKWSADPWAQSTFLQPSASTMRVLSAAEQNHLGCDGWSYLLFLVSVGALPQARFELVMDRVMATPDAPMELDDLKLIVLMVYWSLGEEPAALVLDDLCDSHTGRIGH
ncbi:protein Smg [Rhodoferax lithotrophicus]|uniref:Protein Smg homolog n=1 Tax=Rhodoferax lithotrophicus TaxID=2798804 RepID=A0ABN6DBM5_9BURK|nr:DUF494 domain-containing protein [Rhodoferax sp. MIZ03]BCO29407.1 protein Smg [Rhodoferax sp. MIZ03]